MRLSKNEKSLMDTIAIFERDRAASFDGDGAVLIETGQGKRYLNTTVKSLLSRGLVMYADGSTRYRKASVHILKKRR